MYDGQVIQVGAPAEIYEKPRTRFVASFMDASNIFSVKVVSHNGNGLVIQDKSGQQSVHFPKARLPGADSKALRRIRLRAVLFEGDLTPCKPLEDFIPCKECLKCFTTIGRGVPMACKVNKNLPL